jgi:hypothetical protein
MIVQMYTITNKDQEVWIDTYIDENKISVGWRIPAYVDEDITDLIVYSDELNLFIDGNQISVKSTEVLLSILQDRLG